MADLRDPWPVLVILLGVAASALLVAACFAWALLTFVVTMIPSYYKRKAAEWTSIRRKDIMLVGGLVALMACVTLAWAMVRRSQPGRVDGPGVIAAVSASLCVAWAVTAWYGYLILQGMW